MWVVYRVRWFSFSNRRCQGGHSGSRARHADPLTGDLTHQLGRASAQGLSQRQSRLSVSTATDSSRREEKTSQQCLTMLADFAAFEKRIHRHRLHACVKKITHHGCKICSVFDHLHGPGFHLRTKAYPRQLPCDISARSGPMPQERNQKSNLNGSDKIIFSYEYFPITGENCHLQNVGNFESFRCPRLNLSSRCLIN